MKCSHFLLFFSEIDGEFIENMPKRSKSKRKLILSNQEISKDSQKWETIRGTFMHVACLSNSAMWDQSSGGGLSKYGHLADGFLDLILVRKVSRKEFYRFIKRHTNSKNQVKYFFIILRL